MIIVGAQGFAKQLAEVFFQRNWSDPLYFFDNISHPADADRFRYPVLTSFDLVRQVFEKGSTQFCLGLAGPTIRQQLARQFIELGGTLTSVISPLAAIGRFAQIGPGVTILTGAVIENDADINEGALINTHASVHHDCVVGRYVEIAPGARVLGSVKIGDLAFVGANATLLPKIRVGEGAIVGAGAVVTKHVEPFSIVAGNPARIIRYITH